MMDVRQDVLWEEAPICSLRNMFIGKQFACDHIDDDASDEDGIDLYIIGAVCLWVCHKSDYFAASPKSAYK